MLRAEEIRQEAKDVMKEVIRWRRHLHERPEVGFDLQGTIRFVCSVLDDNGIEYDACPERSYVVAYVNRSGKGKVVAVRADMDALPVQEETGLAFASKVAGRMHACGHDAHTACLLGLAKLLNKHKDNLNGCVKLLFQPAEELGTGSPVLIEDGVLDDADEIIGMHNGNLGDGATPGDMIFSDGPMMATMDKFTLTVKGQGAHGSTPQHSVDPITITSYVIAGLQEIVSREIDPRDPAVISVCSIHAGKTFNVIPDCCELAGTTRVFTNEIRDYVERRIGEVAETVARAYRADVEYRFFRQPPPLVNDKGVSDRLIEVSRELYPDNTLTMQRLCMAGEDFAWYLQKVRGSFFFLCNPLSIEGKCWPHHSSKFAIDEQYLDRPLGVMAGFIMRELQ
ncbi:amidohydrolase [Olsenella profusa DSM 13989]|uniref:M20 metallopeptidase family protein n=1 Tax=Olsenella profusa TaxID=138595 RepID=UPI0027829164|nr:M20 family metallopeptidase [Olsenella profusa]MDP9860193.1 amidohydrolase [Olsenella profusa DSM 13989]